MSVLEHDDGRALFVCFWFGYTFSLVTQTGHIS